MKKKNLTIWIVGANSSGKTMLARAIHNMFSKASKENMSYKQWVEYDEEKKMDKKCGYTIMNRFSCNLGKLDSAACGGTDTLNSRFQVKRSFEEACKMRSIVVIEGILATGTWIEFLKRDDNKILMVLLDIDEETNHQRLRERRAKKLGCDPSDIEITENTRKNVEAKRNTHRSLFNRMEGEVDVRLNLNTKHMSLEDVREAVNKQILQIL